MLEINIQQPDPFSLTQPPLSPFSLRTFPSREECQTLGFDPFSVPPFRSRPLFGPLTPFRSPFSVNGGGTAARWHCPRSTNHYEHRWFRNSTSSR